MQNRFIKNPIKFGQIMGGFFLQFKAVKSEEAKVPTSEYGQIMGG
jgi:hypothetical protein